MTKRTISVSVETHASPPLYVAYTPADPPEPSTRTVKVNVYRPPEPSARTIKLNVYPSPEPGTRTVNVGHTPAASPAPSAPERHTIRKHRNRLGLSVAQSARRAGVCERSWKRWEAGSRLMPADLWQSILDW